ncbi:hypothetical protein HGH93_09645 [Chitinophaga polysaccharea]|uniref:hypothetical protein n=1 Tax=Chitinophaga TaxID=79328 RepID=UPI001455ABBD|nr:MULTISPECIES: hypothetical protein [Chitinophaga]NLR58361.1 hypothetical protein [Chitinophaga polysaccharea]NLU90888.1 hypothetical protein [Chitinophaga sp. Ak27]
MKKLILSCAAVALALSLSSFADGDEHGTRTTCDALNSQSCIVIFQDGTKVNATGYATIITQ